MIERPGAYNSHLPGHGGLRTFATPVELCSASGTPRTTRFARQSFSFGSGKNKESQNLQKVS